MQSGNCIFTGHLMLLESVAGTSAFLQIYQNTGFVVDLGDPRLGIATHSHLISSRVVARQAQ
jgi:hypothetical protein